MLMWVELTILLLCILIGARLGGISLGTVSGIGLLVFVFVFRMPPGGPPGTVLGMNHWLLSIRAHRVRLHLTDYRACSNR